MNSVAHLFVEDIKAFTRESIQWCLNESESASNLIVQTIDLLIQDAKRVSQLSEESLKAVDELKTTIESSFHADGVGTPMSVIDLVTGLKALCKEHNEVSTIVNPILEALQFQDRMTQNLGNCLKMIDVWLEFRERVARSGVLTDHAEIQFGEALYKITTMSEERDAIKQFFPKSIRPSESTVASVEFF